VFRSPALLPMSRTHAGSQKEARRAAEAAAAAKCVHQHRHQQQHQWKSQITARQHIDARDRLSETQARRDSRDSGASVCATHAGRQAHRFAQGPEWLGIHEMEMGGWPLIRREIVHLAVAVGSWCWEQRRLELRSDACPYQIPLRRQRRVNTEPHSAASTFHRQLGSTMHGLLRTHRSNRQRVRRLNDEGVSGWSPDPHRASTYTTEPELCGGDCSGRLLVSACKVNTCLTGKARSKQCASQTQGRTHRGSCSGCNRARRQSAPAPPPHCNRRTDQWSPGRSDPTASPGSCLRGDTRPHGRFLLSLSVRRRGPGTRAASVTCCARKAAPPRLCAPKSSRAKLPPLISGAVRSTLPPWLTITASPTPAETQPQLSAAII
jgi:hypothetical protein